MPDYSKYALSEVLKVKLIPYDVARKKKTIKLHQVQFTFDRSMYRMIRRYDGITVSMDHPNLSITLEQSIKAFRYKNVIESDFKAIASVLNNDLLLTAKILFEEPS